MISVIKNIEKIITWSRDKNALSEIKGCDILIQDDLVIKIAPNLISSNIDNVIDAKNGLVTPGFIDCHTHPIFSSDRSLDYKLRVEGKTYEQISLDGGGIKSSIDSVRDSSVDDLFNQCMRKIELFLKQSGLLIKK